MILGYPPLVKQEKPCKKHAWDKPIKIIMHKCLTCGAVEQVPTPTFVEKPEPES